MYKHKSKGSGQHRTDKSAYANNIGKHTDKNTALGKMVFIGLARFNHVVDPNIRGSFSPSVCSLRIILVTTLALSLKKFWGAS